MTEPHVVGMELTLLLSVHCEIKAELHAARENVSFDSSRGTVRRVNIHQTGSSSRTELRGSDGIDARENWSAARG